MKKIMTHFNTFSIMGLFIGASIPLNRLTKYCDSSSLAENSKCLTSIPMVFLLPIIGAFLFGILGRSLEGIWERNKSELFNDLWAKLESLKESSLLCFLDRHRLTVLSLSLVFISSSLGRLHPFLYFLVFLAATLNLFWRDIFKELLEKKLKTINLASLFFFFSYFALIVFFSLSGKISLDSDETHNYTHIAQKGFWWAITNYPAPNNHVFFTGLNALFGSNSVFQENIFYTRTLNLMVLLYLVKVVYWFLRSQNTTPSASLFLSTLFCASTPLILCYSIYSRGYLLGSALILHGISRLSSNNKDWLAHVILALAVYTTPTFAYCFPLMFLVKEFFHKKYSSLEKWDGFILRAGLTLITFVMLYAPILKPIFSHSQYIWGDKDFFFRFPMGLSLSFHQGKTPFFWFFLGGILLIRSLFNRSILQENKLLFSAFISFPLIVLIFNIVKGITFPYVRTSIACGVLFNMIILLGLCQEKKTIWKLLGLVFISSQMIYALLIFNQISNELFRSLYG